VGGDVLHPGGARHRGPGQVHQQQQQEQGGASA